MLSDSEEQADAGVKLKDCETLLSEKPGEFVIRRSYLPSTHTYDFRFVSSDLFCPRCGANNVWIEGSEGDYYVGPEHRCGDCEHDFYLP